MINVHNAQVEYDKSTKEVEQSQQEVDEALADLQQQVNNLNN
jgi:hypothetical protein